MRRFSQTPAAEVVEEWEIMQTPGAEIPLAEVVDEVTSIDAESYLTRLEDDLDDNELHHREKAEEASLNYQEIASLAEIARQKELEARLKREQTAREYKEKIRKQKQLVRDRRAKMKKSLKDANQAGAEDRRKKEEAKEQVELEKLKKEQDEARENEEKARKEREEKLEKAKKRNLQEENEPESYEEIEEDDDDIDDYDFFQDGDDDEEAINKATTAVINSGTNFKNDETNYHGPLEVKVNTSKLQRNKGRLGRSSWKAAWIYFFPAYRTILIVYSKDIKTRIELNAVNSSSPTILREENMFNRKQHVVYLENVSVHLEADLMQRDLVAAFESEQARGKFIQLISDYVVTKGIQDTTDDEVMIGTDMTLQEKKVVKMKLRDRAMKRISLLKKRNKQQGKGGLVQRLEQMMKEEDNQSDSEDDENDDDAEEYLTFCMECLTPFKADDETSEEEGICQNCRI